MFIHKLTSLRYSVKAQAIGLSKKLFFIEVYVSYGILTQLGKKYSRWFYVLDNIEKLWKEEKNGVCVSTVL